VENNNNNTDESDNSEVSHLAEDPINENLLDSSSHKNTFLNGFLKNNLASPKKTKTISPLEFQSETKSTNEDIRPFISRSRAQQHEKDHTSSKSLDITKRTG